MTEKQNWEAMAKALWKLLDDISTLGDQYHPEMTPYVRAVDRVCERRGLYLHSLDGYTLVRSVPGEMPHDCYSLERSVPEKMPPDCTTCGVPLKGVAIHVNDQWLCSGCEPE